MADIKGRRTLVAAPAIRNLIASVLARLPGIGECFRERILEAHVQATRDPMGVLGNHAII